MNAHNRAAYLFDQAKIIGCDTPTESMVASAIHAAECDTWNDIIFALRSGNTEQQRAARAVTNWRQLQRSKEQEQQ